MKEREESLFSQQLRLDLIDQFWSREGKELNFGPATFKIQIERLVRSWELNKHYHVDDISNRETGQYNLRSEELEKKICPIFKIRE